MKKKKKKIFNAAVNQFSKKGASSTTMSEIAKEAEVGKGTLYRYFENKEDLISSLIKCGFKNITEEVKEKISNVEEPVEKLKKSIEVQLKFYDQNRNFCRFLTREFWGYKNKFAENIEEIRNSYTVVIEDIIAQGKEEMIFKDLDPELAAVSLIGIVNITALHWFMFKEEFSVDKIKEEVIEIYFNGLIR